MRANEGRSLDVPRALRLAWLMAALPVAVAHGQTTYTWSTNAAGSWTTTNNWMPSTNYPNAAGTVVFITNDFSAYRILRLDTNVTVGTLIFGDSGRNNLIGLYTQGALPYALTFDSGDSRQALLEISTGDVPGRDIGGPYADETDVAIVVSDPQGLFIDNWRSFFLSSPFAGPRLFDGGGHDVTKGEDGAIYFSNRIVTNVGTVMVRDGLVQFQVDGNPALRPGISNVVIGVAPGTIDTGANPNGVITNIAEGGAYDRVQFPYFSIAGAATTNGGVAMTNNFGVTINRGVFRTLDRGVSNASNAPPAVYTGTFTLNGDASETFFIVEHQTLTGAGTQAVRQTIFTGPLTGAGGFTKAGSGEMLLLGTNDFTGAMNVNRGFDNGRGRYGGVGLRGNGVLSGVREITLNRDGSLLLDNSAVNLSNRIHDAAPITSRGRNQIELLGNGSATSYERFGAVTAAVGSLAIEFDKVDGSAQPQTLEIANLVRAPGTVIGFHASDLQQGVFGNAGLSNITVNLLDGGASLAQVGADGGAGSVNRSVVVGVFGGDGVDNGSADVNTQTPNRSDEFMTVASGRLRTLDPTTEMVSLGGRSTNALFITQASAASDANVNIDFMTRQLDVGSTNPTNTSFLVQAPVADKRVVGDAAFNSIRIGLVRGTTNTPNDSGRSLLIADGVRLGSESGMLLAGRDTGSTNGDLSPGGIVSLYGGTLDLDGAANNREAIIHNASGAALFIRSGIDASQGLTKSGADSVSLDTANNLGGAVNVAQGSLSLGDNDAVRGATSIRLAGDGSLGLNRGIRVDGVDLTVGERPYGSFAIISQGGHNTFGGDIRIENVDLQGMASHDVYLGVGANAQSATLTLLGDIGITEDTVTPDIYLTDAARIGVTNSGGILNLYGTVGDRLVNGEAVPIDPAAVGQTRLTQGSITNRAANENQALRFLIDGGTASGGGDELVVNIKNSWNAAGRIYAEQGTIRFLGDPGQGMGTFWTTNVEAISFADENFVGGFVLGGPGTDAKGSVTLLMTRDGQAFNARQWLVAGDNGSDNTVTIGLEHSGPADATVTIGSGLTDEALGSVANRITLYAPSSATGPLRELRIFAHDGYDSATGNGTTGTVRVAQSIRGVPFHATWSDFATLTVVGNGTVVLSGITNGAVDENNDIRAFNLLGGELILDRSNTGGLPGDVRRTADSRSSLTLAGGDLTYLGRNSNTYELLNSNLTVRAGDSRIGVHSVAGGNTDLLLATNRFASVARSRGGTVLFSEDNTAGGNARVFFAPTNHTPGSRIGSWATYGTNLYGGAFTWAATDTSSNLIAFSESDYGVDIFGSVSHVHLEAPAIFFDESAASLRFTNAVTLDLNGFALDVVEGGILLSPSVAGAATIQNGSLSSSGGELIVHNYADPGGGFTISAGITGSVDLTFSGTGKTVLSGSNTFSGVTRINVGTVEIDRASRLGNTVSNLEMRGGTLFTTASMTLTNRTIILGGDGGTFQVATGTTNALGSVLTESNSLSSTRLNNGHGDLIKTGGGTLELRGSGTNNLTAGYQMYQGLTDVREGTLRLLATNNLNNFALGSNKSFYDGTIVRSGATLAIGSNNVAFPSVYQEWLMLEQGSTFRVENRGVPTGFYQWNGVIDLRGDASFVVEGPNWMDLNSGGQGYLMGSGDIIKDGDGTLVLDEHSPEFTGDLRIRDGYLMLYGNRQNTVPNAGAIHLGQADLTNRSVVAFYVRMDRDGYAGATDIGQDIAVHGNSSDTRLGVYDFQHNDVVNFNGKIDLTDFNPTNGARELQLYVEDDLTGRAVNGADALREEVFVNLNGDITGGDKRIRTHLTQNNGMLSSFTYSQTREPIPGMQLTNEMNMMAFFTLAGTNTGWTGSLEVGNRSSTLPAFPPVSTDSGGPDQDKQHFVRFGRNDGAATLAIGASNSVVLRHDATLQAYGSVITIGNLFSDGDPATLGAGSDGFYGNQLVTNTYLENGGTVAGTFIINQTSNRVFQGVIRDGTYHSPDTTNQAAAALNLVKRGYGMLVFDQSNYYSGTTMIEAGTLRVNGRHMGGGQYTVMGSGILGGTGVISSVGVVVFDGGTLAPGNSPGTLTIVGDLGFSNGAVLAFDLSGSSTNAGGGINDLVVGVRDLLLDGTLEVAWTNAWGGWTTNDFWTLITYEGVLTDLGLDIDMAGMPSLGSGLSWYIDTRIDGEVRLSALIPEPGCWVGLVLGLALVTVLARARRATV